MGEMINPRYVKFVLTNLKGKDHFGELGIDGGKY
jgi:hypothetical protein